MADTDSDEDSCDAPPAKKQPPPERPTDIFAEVGLEIMTVFVTVCYLQNIWISLVSFVAEIGNPLDFSISVIL